LEQQVTEILDFMYCGPCLWGDVVWSFEGGVMSGSLITQLLDSINVFIAWADVVPITAALVCSPEDQFLPFRKIFKSMNILGDDNLFSVKPSLAIGSPRFLHVMTILFWVRHNLVISVEKSAIFGQFGCHREFLHKFTSLGFNMIADPELNRPNKLEFDEKKGRWRMTGYEGVGHQTPEYYPVCRSLASIVATLAHPERYEHNPISRLVKGYLQAASVAWTCNPCDSKPRDFFDFLRRRYEERWEEKSWAFEGVLQTKYWRWIEGIYRPLPLQVASCLFGIPSWISNYVFFRTRTDLSKVTNADRFVGLPVDCDITWQEIGEVQLWPDWNFLKRATLGLACPTRPTRTYGPEIARVSDRGFFGDLGNTVESEQDWMSDWEQAWRPRDFEDWQSMADDGPGWMMKNPQISIDAKKESERWWRIHSAEVMATVVTQLKHAPVCSLMAEVINPDWIPQMLEELLKHSASWGLDEEGRVRSLHP
jgi:hypothetical protein